MNVPDIGPLGREVTGAAKRTGQTDKTAATAKETVDLTETAAQSEITAQSTGDAYRSSGDRKKIEELAAKVESEPEPRDDAVEQARVRVATGYYQSDEFLGRLAFKLQPKFDKERDSSFEVVDNDANIDTPGIRYGGGDEQ